MHDLSRAKVLFIDGELERAAEMFYECAADGDAEAAFNYGYCLLHGYGVERDPSLAKSFFTFASGTVGEADYNLAVMYMHGTGVRRDYRRAYSHMHDAAELNIIEAQLYLGVAHTMGMMFEPDIVSISLIPYHTPEYLDTSVLIGGDVEDFESDDEKRARAVREDQISAFTWFRMAAVHSPDYVEELSRKGKFLYARCFLDGLGVDTDRQMGDRLMLMAAADGSPDAVAYIETEAPHLLAELNRARLLNGENSN